MFIYGFLNTLFITINAEINDKESDLLQTFGMNQVMDILCYQTIVILCKAIMFWAITNDEHVPCWKRTLIFLLALLPYVIIFLIILMYI